MAARAINSSTFESWIFDLDNTLYPADCDLFTEVAERMTGYVAELLGRDRSAARKIRHDLFIAHGTTLRGLMIEHDVDPDEFLDYVHDIDFSVVKPDPELAGALERLPGRKIIFTNASRDYAERVIERLGLAAHFDGLFDIEAADYIPKPHPETYRNMLARFAIEPASAVMVEDMARNLVPAAALGMTTVWLPTDNDWAREQSGDGHIDLTIGNLTDWLTACGQARPAEK